MSVGPAKITAVVLAVVAAGAMSGCTAQTESDAGGDRTAQAQTDAPRSVLDEDGAPDVPGDAPLAEPAAYNDVDIEPLLAEPVACERTERCTLVRYEDAQAEWSRITDAWPLPTPEENPFPEELPVDYYVPNEWYLVGFGLQKADLWWRCAVETAAVDARAAGDDAAMSYWLGALRTYAGSDVAASPHATTGEWLYDIVDAAEAGDIGELRTEARHCANVLNDEQ